MLGRLRRARGGDKGKAGVGSGEDSEDDELGGSSAPPRRNRSRKKAKREQAERGRATPGRDAAAAAAAAESGDKGKGRRGRSASAKRKRGRKAAREERHRARAEEEERDKEQASKELLTATDLHLAVEREDLESRHRRLQGHEVAEYVAVQVLAEENPPTVSDIRQLKGASEPTFERAKDLDTCRGRVLVPKSRAKRFGTAHGGSRWKEEVYVENYGSGRFSRTLYDLDELGQRLVLKKHREEENLSEYSPQRLRALMDRVEYALEGIFMVSQGLLAGGSLLQLIVVLQVDDPVTLLGVYGPLAHEVRRMFFFLSVFAFVGVCDKIAAERSQHRSWSERGAKERAEMYLYAIFLLICLLLTLLAWPLVDRFDSTYAIMTEVEQAGKSIVLETGFEEGLEQWRRLIGMRFGFAALGWLLICQDTNRDLLRGRQRTAEIERCRAEVEASEKHVARLGGKMLEGTSEAELGRLYKTLSVGLEEVRLQLKIRHQLLLDSGHANV